MVLYDKEINKLHKIAADLEPDLAKLGIGKISDLIWYFPFRYDDLSQIKSISEIKAEEVATLKVQINKIKNYRSWKKKITITEIIVSDESSELTAVWFNQKFIGQILKTGDEVYLSGKVQDKNNKLQLINPTYEKVKDRTIHSAGIIPNYHLSGKITQRQLRFLISLALKALPYVDDPLPADLLNTENFPWLHESLQAIHFPISHEQLQAAARRLKFQELFYLQCKYQLAKKDYQAQPSLPIPMNSAVLNKAVNNLPFKLTSDQQQALAEVLVDLQKKQPMNRLIEGDVGSGKTIVALLAALNVISQPTALQAALMAPTEILAWQHFNQALKILPEIYQDKIAILTSGYQQIGQRKSNKRELLAQIKNGKVQFVIGTQALIQDQTDFGALALAIVDEQHRFGVKQRQHLKQKNKSTVAHLLSLTATPIPRTLALTLYGDLDISLIQQKPAGRQQITTILVPEKKRQDAYKFIREKISKKEQVFVICPLIDPSDSLGYKSVKAEYEKLNNEIFPDLTIGLLHGKLSSEEKEKLMTDFKNNVFPILVATSVIEVGVDIPQATIMVIESAEKFGLSQLHQFRGRIGRNNLKSYCLLFTTDDDPYSKKRLTALAKTEDGFKLSEIDLELRGSGEIFGTKQTGLMKLKIAKLSDGELIKKAQNWALKIISEKKYQQQKQLQTLLAELKTEMHLE